MPISEISNLIEAGSTERELQEALKRSLHLIAKTVANSAIKDEWIVFSEYPIQNGFADFVVFTDRSRMDVVIFEIKGADFHFVNADGTVSKPISDAAQQMRNRFAHIEQIYEPFRRNAYSLRRRVEAGETVYNSMVGPKGYLHVDPEKDIDVWGVVIGGRTRDDHVESHERNVLEKYTHRVRFESWDSWLRKLRDL